MCLVKLCLNSVFSLAPRRSYASEWSLQLMSQGLCSGFGSIEGAVGFRAPSAVLFSQRSLAVCVHGALPIKASALPS